MVPATLLYRVSHLTVGLVAVLAATHLLGYWLVDAGTAVVLGHTDSLLSSAAMAWVFWWYLRRQGRLLDDANARAPADEVHHRGVGEALEVVGAAESLWLRVTARYQALPEVPPEVSVALADAVREALNNVRRHAGTDHAYLTATGTGTGTGRPGTVVVTVVDRGCGFDPKRHEPGLGLRRSVGKRMTAVGGRAELDTEPGEGVRVELRWPG